MHKIKKLNGVLFFLVFLLKVSTAFSAGQPTLTSPAADTSYSSSLNITYTLPEAAASVTLTFTGLTTVTLTMSTSANVNITLNAQAITPNSNILATSASSLPAGSYTVTLDYHAASDNSLASDSNLNVLIGFTPSPIVATDGGVTSFSSIDGIPITYTIPVTPTTNTVKVTIHNNSAFTIIDLPDTSGSNLTATLDIEGLFDDGTYDLTLSYQDSFGDAAASATITDIDIATPTISTSDLSATLDSSSVDVLVTLLHSSTAEITVDYTTVDDTATAGTDYTFTSGSLTWTAGNTSAKTIEIPLTTSLSSNGKIFNLVLSSPVGAVISEDTSVVTLSSSFSPTETSYPTFTSPAADNSYPGTMNIAYTLPEAATPGTVQIVFEDTTTHDDITFTMNDNASASFDIDTDAISSSNIISVNPVSTTIPPGVYDVTLSYRDLQEHVAATVTHENVAVTLPDLSTEDPILTSPASNQSYGSSFSLAYTLGEAALTGTVLVTFVGDTTVTLTMSTDTSVEVDLDINNVAGSSFFDIVATDPALATIPPGVYDVTLSYQDVSGNLAASVTSSNVSIDVDTSTLPTISTSDVSPEIDADSAVITVTLSEESSSEVSVDYTTVDGTAKAGEDYTEQSGTLTWSAGNTDDQTITIPLTTNASSDGKTFSVVLDSASGATLLEGTSVVTLSSSEEVASTTEQKSPSGGCSLRR